MSAATITVPAAEVRVGDRIETPEGIVMTVTRIDEDLLGRPGLLAFVEDSQERWLKLPRPADAEVDVIREG